MIIDFKQIRNATRDCVDFDYTVDLEQHEHLGERVFSNPISIKGEITNHLGIIRLKCTASSIISCSCARCLKKVNPLHFVEVDNVLSTELSSEDADDTFVVTTDKLELDDVLIPLIILELDMAYLCDDDCKGLCPKCGADQNVDKCSCDTRIIDPRLAVLQKLLDEK